MATVIFCKEVKKSDLKKLSVPASGRDQMNIPKTPSYLDIQVRDSSNQLTTLRFRMKTRKRNNKDYLELLITKGWSKYVKLMKIKKTDTVTFYESEDEAGERLYWFEVQKPPAAAASAHHHHPSHSEPPSFPQVVTTAHLPSISTVGNEPPYYSYAEFGAAPNSVTFSSSVVDAHHHHHPSHFEPASIAEVGATPVLPFISTVSHEPPCDVDEEPLLSPTGVWLENFCSLDHIF